MAIDSEAVAVGESQDQLEKETAEEPKRKKLKQSDQSDARDDQSTEPEERVKGSDEQCEEEKPGPPTGPFEPIKPEIYFSDTFVNELFVRRDGKRPQDKSVVYFLEPNDELEVVVSAGTDRPEGAPFGGDANDQKTNKMDAKPIESDRPVGKRKPKDAYRVECIQDGRKLGSTKKNYDRLLLALSPASLGGLITSSLEKNKIDLAKNKSIEAYDLTWKRLKEQCPNFVRWTNCGKS